MRTWGRQYDESGNYVWVEVSTAPNGDNSAVYVTALIQCLKMGRGESPIFGDSGIPAQGAVASGIPPDYFVQRTQQQFAPFFASLIVNVLPGFPPTYVINATTFLGAVLTEQVNPPS